MCSGIRHGQEQESTQIYEQLLMVWFGWMVRDLEGVGLKTSDEIVWEDVWLDISDVLIAEDICVPSECSPEGIHCR